MAAAMTPDSGGGFDRLGVTLLFSLLAHAVLALGITFDFERAGPSLPALDVILVQTANSEVPEKADFIAQASNSGGGEADTPSRPTQPLSGPLPTATAGVSPVELEDGSPAAAPPSPVEHLTGQATEFSVSTAHAATTNPQPSSPRRLEFEQRKLEMARLAQEIQREAEKYAKRPKKKYISANTKEYEFAAYMHAWVARIERIGNLNYPDEARQRQLHGQLVLTVGLARDGSVDSIDVIQSSGHKVLDDAAIRIVRLAEPFPSLPQAREEVDELYITRTWQFLPGDILRNR
ncbi:energy transducer TonB [Dokdonella sp.]|uniref:energy transducer TonB n=1 Tax=Dokdonella sp. TaxID=2291710 RepID=UPI0031C6253F|nr:TonB family protein [Dokdonella sp.]